MTTVSPSWARWDSPERISVKSCPWHDPASPKKGGFAVNINCLPCLLEFWELDESSTIRNLVLASHPFPFSQDGVSYAPA